MRNDANISRAKWHLWPWKRSVEGKMRSVFTMKFSCSLAKSQESKQMSLKRSWWFGPLFFVFPLFFKLENFLRGELPHCTKLLFLHAFTFTTHATASIWLPRFTRTFFLYLGDSDKWKNLLMNGKSMFWQEKQVDLRCRYPLADARSEGQKTPLRMMTTTPFLFLCL